MAWEEGSEFALKSKSQKNGQINVWAEGRGAPGAKIDFRLGLGIQVLSLKMASPIVPDVPEEFICPISYEVMMDPVLASDGQTYDRSSILEWLKVRQASPLTNEPITAASLVTNYALRSAIERWRGAGGAGAGAAAVKPVPAAPVKPTFTLSRNTLTASCSGGQPETIVIASADVSGSMRSGATNKPSTEGGSFSRLDLVKHSLKTVSTMLAERSAVAPTFLSLQTFSDKATVLLPLRPMNQDTLPVALAAVDSMKTEGITNIWDSLRVALDTAIRARRLHPNTNIQVMLLTDGVPSQECNPPLGIVESLRKKLALAGPITLSAFGFGYELDTMLLRDICVAGGGSFGFISDASMVGTVFINWAAAALNTVAWSVKLRAGRTEVAVGPLLDGQAKILPQAVDPATTTVEFAGETYIPVVTDEEPATAATILELRTILTSLVVDRKDTDAVRKSLRQLAKNHAFLASDIESDDIHKGQLLKAIDSPDVWRSWGLNHCVSYLRALETQVCPNFKDQALQLFHTDGTRAVRDMGNTIFDNLPAPIPSIPPPYSSNGTPYAHLNKNKTMAIFNNAHGGCWAGYCQIRLADGSLCYANQLDPGAVVWGGHRVLCVVRTHMEKKMQMCKRGGLVITPWHPVRAVPLECGGGASEWKFPAEFDLFQPHDEFLHYVYNLVLESGHTVEIDGFQVCTLAHGFEDNAVIRHPYFGTTKVLEDLQKSYPDEWDDGYITLEGFERDKETGLVSGLSG